MADATAPLITTVIPTRGRAGLVTRAIESALNQTYTNVEVIVVLDGSDLETAQMLKAFAEPRLRVIALSENVGGSEARNVGVRAARGRWIALLDDDDQWFPNKLVRQMAMVAEPAARHSLITCRRLERQPGYPDTLAPHRTPSLGEDVSEYMFYSESKLRHTCGPQTSSFLGTKELFLDVPFAKGLKCHQDWDWYLRATCHGTTVSAMVEEPLYIMYVERERPRLTQIARWEDSLEWIGSHKDLFTTRAHTSFLINECMFRCEQTSDRMRVFRRLIASRRQDAKLRMKDLIAIAKWYLFRPSVRLQLKDYRMRLQASERSRQTLESQPRKQEVHG